MQVCPNCSHRNRLGVIFCDNCGASLIGDSPLSTKNIGGNAGNSGDAGSGSNESFRSAGTDVFSQGTVLRVEIEGAEPILLKPKRETVFGRRDPATGTMPDVDLTPFAGYRMGVSRRHIVIRQSDDTRLDIIDLGSSNGTYVNGQKLSPNQPQRLRDGDELRLGQMVMKIFFQKPLIEDTPASPKTPVAEANKAPASPPVAPAVAPPAVAPASGPTTGTPPVVTQPGEARSIVPPPPVIVQPPQLAPAGGAGTPDNSGDASEANPSGTGTLPPLPPSPNGPSVQSDPSGTKILQDPDAKP